MICDLPKKNPDSLKRIIPAVSVLRNKSRAKIHFESIRQKIYICQSDADFTIGDIKFEVLPSGSFPFDLEFINRNRSAVQRRNLKLFSLHVQEIGSYSAEDFGQLPQ